MPNHLNSHTILWLAMKHHVPNQSSHWFTTKTKNNSVAKVIKEAFYHIHLKNILDFRYTKNEMIFLFIYSLALSRKRIGLMSMLGVYVVLGVGIVVAFLTLIAEILWKRKDKLKSFTMTKRFVTA